MKAFFSEYKYDKAIRRAPSLPSPTKLQHAAVAIANKAFYKGSLEDNTVSKGAFGFTDPQAALSSYIDMQVVAAQVHMMAGRGTDYFIVTPELTDLILGMVREFTADVLDVFAESRETAFVIHPIGKPAVLVGISTVLGYTSAVFHAGGSEEPRLGIGGKAYNTAIRMKPRGYAESLAIGLALYMRHWPEAVKTGLPEFAKHPSHYAGSKCAAIGVAEELIDRSGPKPHIRKAHFRFLESERFVHKKGTYVLVKPTFVRGKCKIVVEVEE